MPISTASSTTQPWDGRVMADGDPVADHDGIKMALPVEYGAVLDVGVCPDADGVYVSAQHGIHPYGGVIAQGYVPDKLGGRST